MQQAPPPKRPPPRLVYPIPQFVGELEKAGFKISERSVWRLIAAGKIKAIKISIGRTAIPGSEFERVLTQGVAR